MADPLKRVFPGKAAKEQPSKDVFATTLFRHKNTVSGDDRYHCMVARARIDGMWEVGHETYFNARATNSMVQIPPRPGSGVNQTPEIVDGQEAYDMLAAYEQKHMGKGGGEGTRMLDEAGHVAQMKPVADKARLTRAEKSGGVAMKMAVKRKKRRALANTL